MLKIEYGLDSNKNIINIKDAQKGEKYYCPCCSEILTLKQGKIKVWHYSHSSNSNCSKESVEHKLAKEIIKNKINNKENLIIKCSCFFCDNKKEINLNSNYFKNIELEKKIGNYIYDLLATTIDNNKLAIEIRHTHKVDQDKHDHIPIKYIEVIASDVIKNPNILDTINFKLDIIMCADCNNFIIELIKTCKKYNINKYSYFPIDLQSKEDDYSFEYFSNNNFLIDIKEKYVYNYIPILKNCKFCKQKIPFFKKENAIKNPTRKPETIVWLDDKKIKNKKYYCNKCPNCNKYLFNPKYIDYSEWYDNKIINRERVLEKIFKYLHGEQEDKNNKINLFLEKIYQLREYYG